MSTKSKTIILVLLALLALTAVGIYLAQTNIPVLQPAGPVGQKEKHLIIEAGLLSSIVVIPIFGMLIGFSWKYREGNKKAKYSPNFSHNRALETIWWGSSLIIISILGVITWHSSRELDPFKSLVSKNPPMTIQVVSLQWKWLFIYPQQKIATINYLQLPKNVPIDFEITSDAPMNSFWIPQLGGQIYAMSGMSTHMHLLADKTGNFRGESANISGQGFADMHFIAQSTTESDFQAWVNRVKLEPDSLSLASYAQLALPSVNSQVKYYGYSADGLYNYVVGKYLSPAYFRPAEAAL